VQQVKFDIEGLIATVTINRPEARNAVDRPTADALAQAFRRFDTDDTLSVAILTGTGSSFCAGADLKAVASDRGNRVIPDGDGPLGCTRMLLGKPVIAAVEGHAVAGGLELALWCDLRVAARNAVFGVYCRRFGVPLIDGGTVRLPRLIGMSHALDLILTGRGVGGEEAFRIGLANRLAEPGGALVAARELALQIAASRNAARDRIGFPPMSSNRSNCPRRCATNIATASRPSVRARPSRARNASLPAPAATANSNLRRIRKVSSEADRNLRGMPLKLQVIGNDTTIERSRRAVPMKSGRSEATHSRPPTHNARPITFTSSGFTAYDS
jgi:enoyl-CoA hydratase